MKKYLIIGAAIVVAILYLGDAIASKWDSECRGREVNGLWASPATPPELRDPDARVIAPSRPAGCTLTSHNMLRRLVDWFVI